MNRVDPTSARTDWDRLVGGTPGAAGNGAGAPPFPPRISLPLPQIKRLVELHNAVVSARPSYGDAWDPRDFKRYEKAERAFMAALYGADKTAPAGDKPTEASSSRNEPRRATAPEV